MSYLDYQDFNLGTFGEFSNALATSNIAVLENSPQWCWNLACDTGAWLGQFNEQELQVLSDVCLGLWLASKLVVQDETENTRFVPNNDVGLTDLSPKDKPWDMHRLAAALISDNYLKSGFERYSERIKQCSTLLEFALVANDKELFYKLKMAHFCRHRHCTVCQWRRGLKWSVRFLQTMPKIQRDYPTHRYLLLTLTVKNCAVEDLRYTLDNMNQAWRRLIKLKLFPAEGFIKSVEVTRVFDCYDGSNLIGRHGKTWIAKWEKENKKKLRLVDTMDAHPHFHVLLMVPSGYFGKSGGYLSHDKWLESWRKSMRLEYTPVVDIKAIKPKDGQSLTGALKEVLKYSIKPEDLIGNVDWLAEITRQLHKTRAISLGGIFKQYLSEDESEELLHIDESTSDSEPVTDELFLFDWKQDIKRYILRKDTN